MNELVTEGVKEAAKTAGEATKKSLMEGATDFYVAHEPVVLTVGSVVCNGFAIFFAGRDSKKIISAVDICMTNLKTEKDPEIRKKLLLDTGKEIALPVARIVGLYGAATAMQIVNVKHMSEQISSLKKEVGSLTSTLALTTNAMAQYELWKKEAKKELGDEKTAKVNSAVADKIVQQDPPTKENTVNEKPQTRHPNTVSFNTDDVDDMWHYRLDHTGAYVWSNKSPEDIKGWCIDMSAQLYEGAIFDDAVNINRFYDWLLEDMPTTYYIDAFDHNADYTWFAEDSQGQKCTDTVYIDIGDGHTPNGHPVSVLHANFPYRGPNGSFHR